MVIIEIEIIILNNLNNKCKKKHMLYLVMERILLKNNDFFFIKNNISVIENIEDIPNKSCILYIKRGCRVITKILNAIKNKDYLYILILGKKDMIFNYKENIIPNNIVNMYCNSLNYTHPIVKFIPMGGDYNFKDHHLIKKREKNILCYCNYALSTHRDRQYIYHSIKDIKFIKFEGMSKAFNKNSIPRSTFYKRLLGSKFVICPRGNSLDTHRFYDTIYAGGIPIVVREYYHSEKLFGNIPILFLKNREEFQYLTAQFLENKYIKLSKRIKKYYKSLDFNWWIKKMKINLENAIKDKKKQK